MKHTLIFFFGLLSFHLAAQETVPLADSLKTTLPDSTYHLSNKGSMDISDTTSKTEIQSQHAAIKEDTAITSSSGKAVIYQPQIKILFDVGNFVFNFSDSRRSDFEVAVDYHYKNNWYLAAEGGYARGRIDYDNLKYNTNSTYLRIGGDKSLLEPISKRDLDIVFFGFRYGMAMGNRGEAYYIVPSQFGPSKDGTLESQNFMIHWGEMTAGIRVELYKGIYAGWNFRARFLLNGKIFDNKLSPNYVAGYGVADKSTSFGFNVYLGYAIRWNKQF